MNYDVRNQKVAVIGMGRTARSLIALLLREGARPFVSEAAAGPHLDAFQHELRGVGVDFETGGHTLTPLDNASFVVPGPGVPLSNPLLRAAREKGIPVISELEFAHGFIRSRILAITGTNGKTTTTELLRAIVESCGHSVALAGNNATPASDLALIQDQPPYAVLEVSSYQLEYAHTFRPWIATVLNVTPDHLDWHGGMDDYVAAKARIFAAQGTGDHAVVNADDEHTRTMLSGSGARRLEFSASRGHASGAWVRGRDIVFGENQIVASLDDIQIPGHHNVENVLAAVTMACAGGFRDGVRLALRAFKGVEHRIEKVLALNGVTYYNDSKSTNPDSLKVALDSFDAPIVLIAGGRGKGGDYRDLRDRVRDHVKAIVTIGEDAARIENAFADIVPAKRAESMEDAVDAAREFACPGDAVLLSPACASFDMFDNFEHRGRVFKECVRQLSADGAAATTGAAHA